MEEIRLLTDGYFYWQNKREHPSDVVTTQLIGKRWLCGADPETADAVYDPDRVVRKDAVPEPSGCRPHSSARAASRDLRVYVTNRNGLVRRESVDAGTEVDRGGVPALVV